MENKSCMTAIRETYDTLTAKEKKVADCILAQYDQVAHMPIGQLAANAGAAKSAVVRFCQALGFRGYADLKMALSKEAARNELFHYTPYIRPEDDESAVLDKIFSANIKTLHDTKRGIDRRAFCMAGAYLRQAQNIYVYGIGTSAGIAKDFQYRLMQLGYTAFCFTDIVSMKVSALNIRPEDVALGISHSGRTMATVDALSMARKKGAKTLCLTSYPKSRIIAQSDCPLVVVSDEIQYPIEAISARIAHITLLDALAVSLSAQNFEAAMERAEKTHEMINTVRYQEGKR